MHNKVNSVTIHLTFQPFQWQYHMPRVNNMQSQLHNCRQHTMRCAVNVRRPTCPAQFAVCSVLTYEGVTVSSGLLTQLLALCRIGHCFPPCSLSILFLYCLTHFTFSAFILFPPDLQPWLIPCELSYCTK